MNEWSQLIERAIKRCQETEAQARKERKIWEELKKRLAEADQRPFAVISLIEQLRKLQSPSVQDIAELEREVKEKANEQINHYRDLLIHALKDDGCTIEGRFPEYRVNKIIEVRIDERRLQAKVGTRFHTEVVSGDISVVTIAELIRKEVQRLFNRPFDAREFLKMLWQSYLLALTIEGKTQRIGENVRIWSVHKFTMVLKQKEVAFSDLTCKKFTPYLPDEFAVDIGKLLAEGVVQTDQGCKLHLIPVRNPKEAIFIVNWAKNVGQNYGFLSFRE